MLEQIAPYFIALVILSIIAEAWYSKSKNKGLYDTKDTWINIAFGIFGVLTRMAFKGMNLLLWIFLFELVPFQISTSVLSILILFILNEFIYYWFHRWSHENRVLWATHVNHHSSLKMNFSVAARTPFLNAIYHAVFWTPLPLLGFNPLDILAVETISFLFAFMQHTTIVPKLGFLEYFMNTPSHHRVHHANNGKYLNKNYGNTLIIFDRIFGTFVAEDENEKPVYGLVENPKNRGLFNLVFHEWIAIFSRKKQKSKATDEHSVS